MTAESYVDRAVQLGVGTFGSMHQGINLNDEALRRLALDYSLKARGYLLDGETPEVLPQVPVDELDAVRSGLLTQIKFNLVESSPETL